MSRANLNNLLKETLSMLPPRVREVVSKRFGLNSPSRQTLEAIGLNYGVTRERVRQIEVEGLKRLTNKNVLEAFGPVFDAVFAHLKKFGGLRREDYFLKELSGLFGINENNIRFVLTLGQLAGRLHYFKPDPVWHASWGLDHVVHADAVALVTAVAKEISVPTPHESVVKILAEQNKKGNFLKYDKPDEKILLSCLALSREVAQNSFGEWGLVTSPEISPRGMKDKAYLVFKRENQPLHFKKVAELINQAVFSGRKAHYQTVHNELIKDERFVLVGRGTYALRNWGYEPGTVRDVVFSILKNRPGGLAKEEIVKAVQAKRLVKENTILLNLQNRKYFKKLDDGRFILT